MEGTERRNPRLSASLAAAPLTELKETVAVLERAGVEMLHFDIEDGIFVPDLTLGTKMLSDLRALSGLTFDVHLSVIHPERLIPDIASKGADRIAVHWEACEYPLRTLEMIREAGSKAGLAFNPKTPIPELDYLLSTLDYVQVLSTEPVRGQSLFIPEMLDKISRNKPLYDHAGLEWVIDGGILPENAGMAVQKGADVLVIGRSIFEAGKILENVKNLKAHLTDPPAGNRAS